jgi:hypothetical protein
MSTRKTRRNLLLLPRHFFQKRFASGGKLQNIIRKPTTIEQSHKKSRTRESSLQHNIKMLVASCSFLRQYPTGNGRHRFLAAFVAAKETRVASAAASRDLSTSPHSSNVKPLPHAMLSKDKKVLAPPMVYIRCVSSDTILYLGL